MNLKKNPKKIFSFWLGWELFSTLGLFELLGNVLNTLIFFKKLISLEKFWWNCSKFGGLVEVESTYWGVVKLFNTQNKLMDVHQSDISKILLSSTSNLVSFIFIKSRHFTEAYLVLLHKTSHTSCILFFFWFPRACSRERAHLLFHRGKIVRAITTTET